MLKLSALLLALSPILAHADVRPVAVLPGFQADLASVGNITALLTHDFGPDTLSIQISDGRGLTWSAPKLVTPAGVLAKIYFEELAIVGDKIFIAYADDRNEVAGQGSPLTITPFVRVYDTASGIFSPEIQIPTATIVGNTSGDSFDFTAVEVAGATHLHLATLRRVFDPVSGTTLREVILYSSPDGGTSWAAPLVIDSSPVNFFSKIRVVADGNQVHVLYGVWTANFDPELMDQRSLDGGFSTDFAQPKKVPGGDYAWSFEADLDGSLLAIVYENLDGSFSEAWAVTSNDGGATYNAVTPFNTPPGKPSFNQSYEPRVTIAKGTQDVTATTQGWGGFGEYMVSMIHSSDGGQTWPDRSMPFETGAANISDLNIIADSSGRDRVSAIWRSGSSSSDPLFASNSFDGGATFETPFLLSSIKTVHARLAWNDLYQNAICSFSEWILPLGPVPSIGGWRPQTIAPDGFTAGSASIGNSFANFDGGADVAFLLLSTQQTPNPIVLGDGRSIGLGDSALFAESVNLALSGTFSAIVNPMAGGAINPLAVGAPGVPPGLTLYAVGISLDITNATLLDISDVVRLDT